MTRALNFIHDNTWFVILVAVVVSLAFPAPGNFLKPHLNLLLGVLTFLSCLDLNVSRIVAGLTDIKSQALSLLIVHLVAPTIIFVLRDSFPPQIYLGLIIAATIPAGRSAVFLCTLYGGDPIKALLTSSLSNTLAPILVPALVWIFAHTTVKIDIFSMGSTIFYLVIIPLVTGFLLGRTSPGQRLNQHAPTISTLILFLIILGILSPIRPIIAQNPTLSIMLVLIAMALSIINFILGYSFPRLHIDKVTYGLSSSYKNYTLGTLLSLSLFSPLVALPSIAYTVANNLLLIPLQFFLRQHQQVNKSTVEQA